MTYYFLSGGLQCLFCLILFCLRAFLIICFGLTEFHLSVQIPTLHGIQISHFGLVRWFFCLKQISNFDSIKCNFINYVIFLPIIPSAYEYLSTGFQTVVKACVPSNCILKAMLKKVKTKYLKYLLSMHNILAKWMNEH